MEQKTPSLVVCISHDGAKDRLGIGDGMGQQTSWLFWKWWFVAGVLVAGILIGTYYSLPKGSLSSSASANEEEDEHPVTPACVRVEVIHPQRGGMDRTTVQPGSVQAYESAQLYAEVSGYMKTQTVDIGDRVKKGQLLAEVDVPDLDVQETRSKAALDQARARVKVAKARVASAQAALEVAKAGVTKAEATAKSTAAMKKFREIQFHRMQELFALKSIDERLVDEKQEQWDAAVEAHNAAWAAIATAKAQVMAEEANIKQAEADVTDAEAAVEVAQAELAKAQVMLKFAKIVSPLDGVVTKRNFFPGDFVRGAKEGGPQVPVLTVERTDLMRVVVQIPDRDVPFADPGDPAMVEIDALPGKKFPAKVSRIASSEDPQTRLMRVEIDLRNPTGKIRRGMYGRVTIVLEPSADVYSVPPSCLVGKAEDGKGSVFVVREDHAHLVPVQIGADNGLRVAVRAGIDANDEVIVNPPSGLRDEMPVVVSASKSVTVAGH
jgi:RND family efflux transporter MFP subunit